MIARLALIALLAAPAPALAYAPNKAVPPGCATWLDFNRTAGKPSGNRWVRSWLSTRWGDPRGRTVVTVRFRSDMECNMGERDERRRKGR